MPLLVHHRRAPAAAPAVSTLSIALAVVGVVTLVISGSITAYLVYRRHQKKKARRSVTSKRSLRQLSASSVVISAPQPAIVLDPATPALPSTEARKSIPISQLPMSTSTSTLGSALEQEDNTLNDARRSSRPFAGPGIIDVTPRGSTESGQPRTSSRNTTRPRRGSTATTGSSRRSKAIPPDLLKTLGDLPSLPPGPSPIRRSFASDRADASANTTDQSTWAAGRRNSAGSLELTPVLDLGSSFRIASGIFGASVNREGSSDDIWLTSVLDSAFNQKQQQQQRNSRTPSPTRALSRQSNAADNQADIRPGSSLTASGSMNSIGVKRSSSRIPVSRSQKQYLDEFVRPLMGGSDMRSLGSDLDSSSMASMHLSTRPSHGALTQHTAPTSIASSDSLSAAAALEAQVFRAGVAQKLPATTMRVSQVFPSSTRRTHACHSSSETARPQHTSTPTEQETVTQQTSEQDQPRIRLSATQDADASLLSAPSFGGLKSVSDTDLHRGASAKDIMMHACASHASLASPFTTPFHHAVFPDEPVHPANEGSQEKSQTLTTEASPARAQPDSTTPKLSPRAGFANHWKAKLTRRVTLHPSPQLDSARPISYIKSSSHLNLHASNVNNSTPSPTFAALPPGLPPSHYVASPDVSSSFNQEEWRINTEDSRDSFSPLFTPSRKSHDGKGDEEQRLKSGLGICVADDDDAQTVSGSRATSPDPSVNEPHSRAHSQLSQGFEYQPQLRTRQKTSPIMQQAKWAGHQLPQSPSIYEDDAKSFVSGQPSHAGQHRPMDGASIFDFDALNAGMSPRLRVDGGSMSPLDRIDCGFKSGNQTTPVMSAGRFTGMSPGALSPYSAAGHPRNSTGRPTSRMVATLRQVEDGMVADSHHSDFSCHASPRSEVGLFDIASAGSCFSAAVTTEDARVDALNAVAARAKLLQSVQADTSREQERQSKELEEHQRRAAEAEASDIEVVESGGISIIEEEPEQTADHAMMPSSPDATLTAANRPFPASLQAKKPRGLSIYVGNAGGSLGTDVVSPLTPPFTPAKTSLESTYFARRVHHRDAASNGSQSNSQRSQSSLRSESQRDMGSEESHDVVPELVSSSSGTGSARATPVPLTPASTSPFKLRPLSLSTSTSVLGEGADVKAHSSPYAPSAWQHGAAISTPTKRTSAYRSSRLFEINASESSGSLASGTTSSHGLGMYSHLTSALGLDNGPMPAVPVQPASKRGSFAYKSVAASDPLRGPSGVAVGL